MTIRIVASGNLNEETFDRCGEFLDDGQAALEVDLVKCRFVDVYCLVALLTIITLHAYSGSSVTLRLPKSRESRTYLARMRFFDLLPPGVSMDDQPPVVTEHPSWLVELAPINFSGGGFAVEQICQFAWPQLPRELREEFVDALAEIGENAVHHAEAEVGFLCAQRFEKGFRRRKPPRFQLVVGDAGIGIRDSLAAARPEVAAMSDGDAIKEALREGVTGKPATHSGVGLSTVQRYADIFGGVLRIRSGRGAVIRRNGRQYVEEVPGLPGTIVAVELASPGA